MYWIFLVLATLFGVAGMLALSEGIIDIHHFRCWSNKIVYALILFLICGIFSFLCYRAPEAKYEVINLETGESYVITTGYFDDKPYAEVLERENIVIRKIGVED